MSRFGTVNHQYNTNNPNDLSDESCKAHQYSKSEEAEDDDGQVYCMLYCRVLQGNSLPLISTKALKDRNFMVGMVCMYVCILLIYKHIS